MARWKGGHCPKCGRPIAQKIGEPAKPCPDCTAAQAESWRETAAQYARNADFYQGIVRQIGELFGEEARTSDDGSVQDDVLALKVPELVEALAAHVERMCDVWQRLHLKSPSHVEVLQAYSYVMRETPTTSLARRDAEQQKIGAASFKAELQEASILPVRVHAEGVFAVWLRRQAEGGDTARRVNGEREQ